MTKKKSSASAWSSNCETSEGATPNIAITGSGCIFFFFITYVWKSLKNSFPDWNQGWESPEHVIKATGVSLWIILNCNGTCPTQIDDEWICSVVDCHTLQHQLQNLDSSVSRDGSKKEKLPFELHNMIQISDHVLKDPNLKIHLSNYSLRTMESR